MRPLRTPTVPSARTHGPGSHQPNGLHGDPTAAHARAEELLARVGRCRTKAERRRLREEAVVLTLDLAESVARRYRGRGIDEEDLLQVARMALVKAARRYRPGRGHGFVAYAYPTITGEIRRHFRDHGWAVRPTRRLQEARAQLVAAEERLTQELHRPPTSEELAEAVGLTPAEVREAQKCAAAYTTLSLDLPSPASARPPVDLLEAEGDEFDELVTRQALADALAGVSERERLLIRLRFVEERTQSEIGAVLGVSQMEVSRMIRRLLRRLRVELLDPARAA